VARDTKFSVSMHEISLLINLDARWRRLLVN
jgi:hypothetical protein